MGQENGRRSHMAVAQITSVAILRKNSNVPTQVLRWNDIFDSQIVFSLAECAFCTRYKQLDGSHLWHAACDLDERTCNCRSDVSMLRPRATALRRETRNVLYRALDKSTLETHLD